MSYSVGALVKARDREWVVLPNSDAELLHLRPLGGADDEVTALLTSLEEVQEAIFDVPDPSLIGDYRSARLLRAAVRLGFRASAGPFRSFAKINVEPRPYQLVPLLMALKLDPVRLLLADDVGIGKTIEALLIARELLDRGEISRLAVLCPPQLAEQWQSELIEKFHIEAELVLSSTAPRLERTLRAGESIFDRYDFTVVSTDFIKSDRRRHEFLRTAPEFIIVDEAHTVVHAYDGRSGRHQRFELVKTLAEDPQRHLLLVTATPHSGKEEAFRALLTLLNSDFDDLPEDLSGSANEKIRRDVARYFVQRRRGDIRRYLHAETPFPERDAAEISYTLTEEYKRLFDQVLRYAREIVLQPGEGYRRRVRWWSALALLRSMASSPAAAAATLRNRAGITEGESIADIDERGRRTVLDQMTDAGAEASDIVPGSDIWSDEGEDKRQRRRLQEMAGRAEKLKGKPDRKLAGLVKILKQLLGDGYSPIVFCRFIPTVEYLQDELRRSIKKTEISGVTGSLPPAEREQRVAQLATADKRILVCTDCLSEGINLQQGFDAVVHYDLSWNPTRHEQREGRVDRYGQKRDRVKVVTYYGTDNQIDGVVLDVLLRKHKSIRTSLGISVSVPGSSEDVIEAIFEGLLLREDQLTLPGFRQQLAAKQLDLDLRWEAVAAREKKSHTMFAQSAIKLDEVAAELDAARKAVGADVELKLFMRDAVSLYKGTLRENGNVQIDLSEGPRGLRDVLPQTTFSAVYEPPAESGEVELTRTHPIVESLANYVMNAALDAEAGDDDQLQARRAGAIRTKAVTTRATLLLLRLRFHLVTIRGGEEKQLLAEDSLTLAFEGAPQNPNWLSADAAEALLDAEPAANIAPQQASEFVRRVVDDIDSIMPELEARARQRGDELLAAHKRVRDAAYRRDERRPRHRVDAQLPPDLLGIYVFLPVPGGR